MAEKVTTMRLKVDLQCEKCYKKVKKVLCKFPQIRDQEFDEKKNIVTIKVVCCSPEKIRDKLCCKGCGAITCIEIVEPPPPNSKCDKPECDKPECDKPECDKPEGDKPVKCDKPPPPPQHPCCGQVKCNKPPPPPRYPCCGPCSHGTPGGPCYPPAPKPAPRPPPAPVPIGTCCVSCSEGRPGGPCFEGYCRPPAYYQGYFFCDACL